MSARTSRPSRFGRRIAVAGLTVALAAAGLAGSAGAASATGRQHPTGHHHPSGHHHLGTRSLATVLAADGSGFDANPNDFDIADNAIRAVLAADPNSPVKVLADGNTALTAFLPTDRAFEILATQLTGSRPASEQAAFTALAGKLGVPTIANVLLYHVVPGKTITYRQALRSNGAKLDTALSGTSITVRVRYCFLVQLKDNDPDARNPYIVRANINRGNKQIAHGIDRVLRPVNL